MKAKTLSTLFLLGVCFALVGNIPGYARTFKGIKAKLPLVLYSDCGPKTPRPYVASGWMGDVEAISRDECWTENPRDGLHCIRIRYIASGEWVRLAWQDPPNDWGSSPGGYDLTGAKKLTFWARGERGGEKVEFTFGILEKKCAYPDSVIGKTITVNLTSAWKQYSISVKGNKKHIKTGFVWGLEGSPDDITFFLDDIQYE